MCWVLLLAGIVITRIAGAVSVAWLHFGAIFSCSNSRCYRFWGVIMCVGGSQGPEYGGWSLALIDTDVRYGGVILVVRGYKARIV